MTLVCIYIYVYIYNLYILVNWNRASVYLSLYDSDWFSNEEWTNNQWCDTNEKHSRMVVVTWDTLKIEAIKKETPQIWIKPMLKKIYIEYLVLNLSKSSWYLYIYIYILLLIELPWLENPVSTSMWHTEH